MVPYPAFRIGQSHTFERWYRGLPYFGTVTVVNVSEIDLILESSVVVRRVRYLPSTARPPLKNMACVGRLQKCFPLTTTFLP